MIYMVHGLSLRNGLRFLAENSRWMYTAKRDCGVNEHRGDATPMGLKMLLRHGFPG